MIPPRLSSNCPTSHRQAIVEFSTLENADKARTCLHGADIYSNCCTMKVEYSKLEELKVRENGLMSWDFRYYTANIIIMMSCYFSATLPPKERRTVLNDPDTGGTVITGGRGTDDWTDAPTGYS